MTAPLHYVLGNWKMNTTLEAAQKLFQQLPAGLDGVQIGVAAPFPWLVPLATAPDRNPAWLGAQDVSAELSGAYTGDVSIEMLRPYCDFVLIGHSERRHYHPESPAQLQQKVQRVILADRVAVFCVGENLEQRKQGEAETIVRHQLADALTAVIGAPANHLLIAYEPVWAIGTGVSATVEDAAAMAKAIHTWVKQQPALQSTIVPILYGGSVTPGNAAAIMRQPHIDGVLVGGSSLDSESFRTICEAAAT